MMVRILAYDIGTTEMKTCLFEVGEHIRLLADASAGYGLYTLENGGAEQHTDEWWNAMMVSTREVLRKTGAEDVAGISFCSQMQGLVLVDEEGRDVRNPMSYMDQRAVREMDEGIAQGVKVSGMNVNKLVKSLQITGAVSGSVKDPMWKYLWVKNNEPEAFARARWWLDVKEYIIGRMTGEFVMTEDSAYATFLYDVREGRKCWSNEMCEMFGVDTGHLPRIIKTTDVAGHLRAEQADQLGLPAGIPVFGGGGDATLIGIGAGCTDVGCTHAYWGTSGWISTVTDKRRVDVNSMIATIVGAQQGKYNYFAEMETAGKCLEWARDHLALDEIGIYSEKRTVNEGSLYDHLSEVIEQAEPGAGGTIFTPWLHGNRCPFEDPGAAGVFFGIRLETGKAEMIRAVAEGVCYHLRWMLESQEKKVKTSDKLRFCGGGALSSSISQILADITGRTVETVASPQNAGSVGAAITAAVGLGEADSLEEMAELIEVSQSFQPRKEYAELYNRNYEVFRKLYDANKKNFALVNSGRE